MITLIILAILAMSLISVISMNVLNLGVQTEQVLSSTEERANILNIKNALSQSFRPLGLGQTQLAPVGQLSSSDYHTIPSHLPIDRFNAWGREYIYCPYSISGLSGSGTSSVQTSNSTSYSIATVQDSNNIDYVYESSAPPVTGMNILAMIISPIPSSTTPKCEDVRYDQSQQSFYTLNYDGVVQVIRGNEIVKTRFPTIKTLDSSDADLMIDQEVLEWSSQLPEVYTLDFNTGSFDTSDISFINPSKLKNKQISLVGDGDQLTSISPSTDIDITFENVVVHLDSLAFSSNVDLHFINSEVYINQVTTSNVEFIESKVTLTGSVVINATNPIIVSSSNITSDAITRSHLNIHKFGSLGIDLQNSILNLDDLTITNHLSGGTGVAVNSLSNAFFDGLINMEGLYSLNYFGIDTEGELILSSANINITNNLDTFVYSKGNIVLNDVNSQFSGNVSNVFLLDNDSQLTIDDSYIGTPSNHADNGVIDLGGARFVSGDTSEINAKSSCWSGQIFFDVASSNGAYSESNNQTYMIANKSNWLCSIN